MLNEILSHSSYFGFMLTCLTYMAGMWVKKKGKLAIFQPLLVASLLCIAILSLTHVEYQSFNTGASKISYMLTPATVCLAVPLYKQLKLLKENLVAVIGGILAGVLANCLVIFALCVFFRLDHTYYVTYLPKSITTAIGMGVSEEAGGIVSLTVVCIVITGILGNIIGEFIMKLAMVKEPIARGLALGTAAHAIGTAKALELGEIEGAMSSLSVAVAGLITVVAVPIAAGLIP